MTDEDDDEFEDWLAQLTARRARRAEIERSVELRRAELKAQRMARREAELARLQPVMEFVSERLKP